MSLFDKIKANIKKSLGVAADRSKEAWEMANLQSTLWILKKQRDHMFLKMGELVYRFYLNNESYQDIIRERCVEIDDTEVEIKKTEEKIQEIIRIGKEKIREYLSGQQRCRCGALLSEGDEFCLSCGEPIKKEEKVSPRIEEKEEKAPQKTGQLAGYCSICNFPYKKGQYFCPRCGAGLAPE